MQFVTVDIFSQPSSTLPSYCLDMPGNTYWLPSPFLCCVAIPSRAEEGLFSTSAFEILSGFGMTESKQEDQCPIMEERIRGEKAVTQNLEISAVSSRENDFQTVGFESGVRWRTHHPSRRPFPAPFAAVGLGCASKSQGEPNFYPGKVHLTNRKPFPMQHKAPKPSSRPAPTVPRASWALPMDHRPRGCCSTHSGLLSASGPEVCSSCSRSLSDPHGAKSGTSPPRSVAFPSHKATVRAGRLSQTRCHFPQPLLAPAQCG